MNLLRLSLHPLRRDWRAGEWRVWLPALVSAVGSLVTIGLFADRVRQVLQQTGGLGVAQGDGVESASKVIQTKGDEHGQARNH